MLGKISVTQICCTTTYGGSIWQQVLAVRSFFMEIKNNVYVKTSFLKRILLYCLLQSHCMPKETVVLICFVKAGRSQGFGVFILKSDVITSNMNNNKLLNM